jgi:ketosteroid isomerase-like protein
MTTAKRSLFAAAGPVFASLTLACSTPQPPLDEEVHELVELSRQSNAALLLGDAERYAQLVKQAVDFTLMSPFGGKPTHGAAPPERMKEIGKFFKNGVLDQELVQAYSSRDLVVLATIERAHVEVGGMPAQDWALRVTLVYRREGSEWRLAHRHADPLGNAITLPQAAALGRGDRAGG